MRTILYANLTSNGVSVGGIETYLAALIKALGQLSDGEDQYLVLGPPDGADWLKEVIGPNQELRRLPPGRGDGPGRRTLRKVASLFRRIDRASTRWSWFQRGSSPEIQRTPWAPEPPPRSNGYLESLGADVVHFPYQFFIVSSLPSIFNPHDLQHLHLPRFFSPETILRREAVYPVACRLAARVAVASDWTADDVCRQYGLARSKLAVIPWGAASAASPAPTRQDVDTVRAKYQLRGDYVFYPAVAWPHKNHARLIEAFDRLRRRGRELSLVLSGGETPLTPQLKELARQRGLAERVHFLGKVPGADMRPLFRGAAVVAVPTQFEAVSGPIFEAWQESTPVACSDIPQLRGQAEGPASFFDPLSPDSMAEAMDVLLREPARRDAWIEEGRRRMTALTWAETARGYRQLYREIAHANGR